MRYLIFLAKAVYYIWEKNNSFHTIFYFFDSHTYTLYSNPFLSDNYKSENKSANCDWRCRYKLFTLLRNIKYIRHKSSILISVDWHTWVYSGKMLDLPTRYYKLIFLKATCIYYINVDEICHRYSFSFIHCREHN